MIGIVLGKLQAYSLIIALCIIFLGLILQCKKKKDFILLLILLIILSYWTSYKQVNRVSELDSLHNENIRVEAQILQPPIVKENKIETYLKIIEIQDKGKKYSINEKVLASIYYNDEENTGVNISEGDIIKFQGKVRIPRGIRNPGGFDYSLYLKTKGVYSTITIDSETIDIIKEQSLGVIYDFMFFVKGKVVGVIEENLSKDHAALLKGVLFGEKELDNQIRDTFVDSGIAHILAVSGLHVGFLISFVFYITKLFKASNSIRFTIMTLVLIFYIFITGGSASVIRASIMAWIYLVSKIISKRYDGISAISLAGLIILIPNPLLLFTASFQFSFLAALSIVLFYPILLEYLLKIKYIPSLVLKLMAVTFSAQIGTLPVSLFHFHQVSIISLITNLFIIPSLGILLLTAIMAISFYFIVPLIGRYLFFLSGFVFQWIIEIAKIFSAIPFSSISIPPFTWQVIILYIFLCFFLGGYIPLQIKRVKIASYYIAFLLLLISLVNFLLPTPLRVTFLDVNQGDCTLIETPNNKNILIDGGGYPDYQGDRKISQDVLLPTLYSKRITKLDFVIVTHPHDDHIKGIEELIGKIPIKAVGIYEMDHEYMNNFLENCRKNNIQILRLTEGNLIEIEKEIVMEVLSPGNDAIIIDEQRDINNSSIVIRMDYYKSSFLFTGDIENEIENKLIEDQKDINTDVLKVSHHGSNTSSSENFLKLAEPSISVISVGENNNFGHPNLKTIEQLRSIPSNIYRTDENGAIEITTNGNWLRVKPYINKNN
jgi:competence protein ComEC